MVRPIRRIVAGNDDRGIAVALSDGPSPDVRLDPARPGFAIPASGSRRRRPPARKGIRETLHLPHTLEPPPGGSLCRAVEYPPEAPTSARSARPRSGLFPAMGSPGARPVRRAASLHAAHRLARFLLIFEGEITLVLDTAEVDLKAGDQVILRGTNHAWSNRSDRAVHRHHVAACRRRRQRTTRPWNAPASRLGGRCDGCGG